MCGPYGHADSAPEHRPADWWCGRYLGVICAGDRPFECEWRVLSGSGRHTSRRPHRPGHQLPRNLPTHWNGKALQPGGGGYDGTIPNTTGKTTLGSGTAPLTLGYMTFADDSGHKAADSNDASFAVNDEALANFGYMHIKKARDVAFEIARARYGKWPKRLYFSGGSTGGREGLTAAQRWPDDYDGILSNYPTANFLGLRLWGSFWNMRNTRTSRNPQQTRPMLLALYRRHWPMRSPPTPLHSATGWMELWTASWPTYQPAALSRIKLLIISSARPRDQRTASHPPLSPGRIRFITEAIRCHTRSPMASCAMKATTAWKAS